MTDILKYRESVDKISLLFQRHVYEQRCELCQKNLEEQVFALEELEVRVKAGEVDARVKCPNFLGCRVWAEIRKPLTELEAFLTDEEIGIIARETLPNNAVGQRKVYNFLIKNREIATSYLAKA